MTWTRVSDNFNDRPDLLSVPRTARLLYVEALVWANRQETDGFIPRGVLPRISDEPDLDAAAADLERAGVWEPVDGGWQVDWSDQEPAAKVQERRKRTAARVSASRERRERHASGDHSLCDPARCWSLRRNGVSNSVTDGVTNSVTDSVTNSVTNSVSNSVSNSVGNAAPSLPSPSPPSPSRPIKEGRSWEEETEPEADTRGSLAPDGALAPGSADEEKETANPWEAEPEPGSATLAPAPDGAGSRGTDQPATPPRRRSRITVIDTRRK